MDIASHICWLSGVRFNTRAAAHVVITCLLTGACTAGGVTAAMAGDVGYGEYLAGECVTCHRVDGAETNIPDITGWDTESFIAVFNTYRTQERESKVMQTIAAGFDEEQISALAAYFATLTVPETEESQ